MEMEQAVVTGLLKSHFRKSQTKGAPFLMKEGFLFLSLTYGYVILF